MYGNEINRTAKKLVQNSICTLSGSLFQCTVYINPLPHISYICLKKNSKNKTKTNQNNIQKSSFAIRGKSINDVNLTQTNNN